ncbi:MAG: DnaD domain protein [Lachnospiraceae bacterium]|nr:DnaD domain protein [Lachnospiraceae bacterium]
MGELRVTGASCEGFTLVSNLFIDEYMKDANDAQIKVYLYLLRVLGGGRSTSISDMADFFNHTEKDVLRSLKYWEKCGLLSLEYDANKELTGMHLSSCIGSAAPLRDNSTVSGKNVKAADVSVIAPDAPVKAADAPVSKVTEQPKTVSAPSENVVVMDSNRNRSSADCSADKLASFKKTEKAQQLIFVVQQYIPHPLSSNELRSIYFMSDELGMSDDLIDYLVQYCIDRGKFDFRYMEKVALNWVSQNITTARQAASYAKKYDKTIYTVMKALGKSSDPTEQEVAFIKRWIGDFGFSKELILEACNRAVMATDKHRFSYTDGILSHWYSDGIRTMAQIQKQDEEHKLRAAKVPSKPAPKQSNDPFRQFEQRDYDFDALEKQLLSN